MDFNNREKELESMKSLVDENAEYQEEFLKGDQKQVKRGHEIFEALSRGEPKKSLIDQTQSQLTGESDPGVNQNGS